MNTNNIDTYFKSNINQSSDILNKDKAWNKLENKRKNNFRNKLISATVVIILLFSFSHFLIININSNPKTNLSETEKRQKLQKIERNLFLEHKDYFMCNNCNDLMEKKRIYQESIFIN